MMSASGRRVPIAGSTCIRILTLSCALIATARAHAQGSADEREVLRLGATPTGALPPIALPMPASRNNHYWGARLQTGYRGETGGADLLAVAAGIDLQYSGGSTLGVTGGYQKQDCELTGPDCGGHALFGVRTRINLFTGGPGVGGLFGDNSATTTLGTEIGIGYAPSVLPGMPACTFDVGLPVSVSMFQGIRQVPTLGGVRVVSFVTPGVVWDVDCSSEDNPTRPSYLTGFGIGLQQWGDRSLDVYLGVQRIFRGASGFQVGITITYVRLP